MMKKRILILGASRFYLRSIITARDLGYKVIVTDRNPGSIGFQYADYSEVCDISNIEGSIEVAKKYQIHGVVPLNDFGVRTAAAIAEEMGLVGISRGAADCATNKATMRQKWKEAHVPSVSFRVVQTYEEAIAAVKELNQWPLVLKPADSRGGASRGVSVIGKTEDLEPAFEFAQSYYDDKSVIIEEFVSGTEHSLETVTYEGKTYILAVSDKVKTPLPYRVDKSVIYPTVRSGEDLKRIHDAAIGAVKALDIRVGPAHVEMGYGENGPKLFEVGARCGGGGTPDPIVPFVSGVEMFKEVCRIAVGEKPHNLIPFRTWGCVYRFITPEPGIITRISGVDEVKGLSGVLDCEILLKVGDEVRLVRTGGERVGFVIAGGKTREEGICLADRAEENIIFEY